MGVTYMAEDSGEYVFQLGAYGIRHICEEDLPMLLNWRNSPEIHSKMFTDHKITPEEHRAWFKRIQDDPIKKNFIFTYEGQSVGYLGYSVFDKDNNIYSGGSYIGEQQKCPIDAGVFLFYISSEYAYTKLGIEKTCTEVLAENKRALRLNKFFGWKPNHDYDYYVMKDGKKKLVYRGFNSKKDWEERKEQFLDLIQGV